LVFACGDVSAFSRSLWACLARLACDQLGLSQAEAVQLVKRMRDEERLIEDAWS